jgi:hypothetical protein
MRHKGLEIYTRCSHGQQGLFSYSLPTKGEVWLTELPKEELIGQCNHQLQIGTEEVQATTKKR